MYRLPVRRRLPSLSPAARVQQTVKRTNHPIQILRPRAYNTMTDIKQKTDSLIKDNPVIIFSKSYCPYCKKAKQLFKDISVNYFAYELDEESDGSAIQNYLKELTNQSTVPNVFVGGTHVGGFDKTNAAKQSGALKELLLKAGVSFSNL